LSKSAQILKGNFADELKSRYLTYALSTIMSRALPDVRDGLKPVHRRILYSMRMLKLDPEKAPKKCARVVGDVIGKYHPHGDTAVYDAMVRLAQDFAVRYPLVDGQGNFGSVDGDGAAAMRYTEARLTKVAEWIMKDLDSGTVDFQDNYDESDSEPIVMPSCFPNLLANGSSGIAVGLSTSIPPHNVGEICNGLTALLKNPEASDKQVMRHIKGPDFPTGGIMIEKPETIANAYETGRGSFRVRAKWEKEESSRGQYEIIVTEIPYQVQKSRLIEKIADLINAKKLPWLVDVRDESDENIRLVLEPKNRNVDAESLMETLYAQTDLETRISLNMNVITANGTPALLNLREVLNQFLAHRREVLIRRSHWRLDKIAARLHILEAYRIVFLNIDEVIEIIKKEDEPAPVMMTRFGIDDVQAEAILNMRLRRLRKLAEMEINQEYDSLKAEQKQLNDILDSEAVQTETLLAEVQEIKKEFADKRRTALEDAPEAVVIPLEAQIEKEPVTVLLSELGWVRTMKGYMADDAEAKYKEGDAEQFRIKCQNIDTLSLVGTSGRVYNVPISKLPAGRGFGEPINLMFDFPAKEKIVQALVAGEGKYLMATKKGLGFLVESKNLKAQTKAGKQVLNLAKGDKAAFCIPVNGTHVATLSNEKKLLIYPVDQLPTMGRGKGVKLMNVKEGYLADVLTFNLPDGFHMLSSTGNRKRTFPNAEAWVGKRAQVGKLLPHGFHSGVTFYIPSPEEIIEPEEETSRMGELIDAITKPLPDDFETPDFFDDLDKD
jgi:topoisomerase-4 subunit A